MAKTSLKVDNLSYEQALKELEEIVQKLEGNPLELEKILALFERGKNLIQRCQQLLDKADLKVRELSEFKGSIEGQPE